MKALIGKLEIFSFLIASLIATAGDNLPLISNDAAKLDFFFQKVVQENPWMAGTQIPNSMANYRAKEQEFLPGLLQNAKYQELVKRRGEFVTLHIEHAKEAVVRVPVITPQVLERMKQETARTLRELRLEMGQTPAEALDTAIRQRLDALTQSDPRGILTGLVNCLPREKRAPYFQVAKLDELFEKLSGEPTLTEEAVRGNFRGDAHHITADQTSRQYVLAHVGELLQRENELVELLRARWFLKRAADGVILANGQIDRLEALINNSPSETFDINQADEGATNEFFDEILALAPKANALQKKAQNYLSRVEESWRNAETTFEERKEVRGEPYITVRELPAYIVAHRGVLTGDCGTRDDYALIFAPLERNFFIFDANGKVLGYVGATYVNTNNKYTLYIHDITGHGVSQQVRDIIANAFYRVTKQFGAETMTLGSTGYAPYSYGNGGVVANVYLDAEVRRYLAPFCAAPHGDRPEDNPQSYIFTPNDQVLKNLLVRVEGQAAPIAEKVKPKTKKEILTQFLELTAGGENLNVPLDFLELSAKDRAAIASLLKNEDQLPLQQYYERLTQLFAAYDIALSEKFLGRHEAYFIRGHLNAADALTTTDPKYRDRSVGFVLANIRRGNDRDLGYGTIAANPRFFELSEKFQGYLTELPLHIAENLVRLERLIRAGISAEVIAPTDARITELAQVANIHVQTWAIGLWVHKHRTAPPGMLQTLGLALKNDKHETDDTSLLASQLLTQLRTEDGEVIKSLAKSLSREENSEIAHNAGLALLRNGMPVAEIRKLLSKSKIHDQVMKTLEATGEFPPPGQADEAGCAEELNRKAAP